MNALFDRVIVVKCNFCGKEFDLPSRSIKEYSGSLAIPFNRATCPHCDTKDKSFIYINKKQQFGESKNTHKQPQLEFIICPQCQGNQLYASEKGYSFIKGLIWGSLLGDIGLLAGMHGSKKQFLTCLSCGHKWLVGN